ncbi:hypothetical protein KBK19_16215 [Microvirga sp. STR05]|uniref:Uncharacterized protein n=1 Tax=Hymenobacter duratus TaxID=2771356 RepID=A0ABR8JPX0_9BACT|nr:hypothetical protein [Hymenobacter duratus]MBD2716589.1 hypothetical protein [Hymenobacter duratus]MBR7951504.1 hypothetical protein [Microvirga sp. STR05]
MSHADSVLLEKRLVRLQNRRFLDTARFQTFYLSTSLLHQNYSLANLPIRLDELQADQRIAPWLTLVAPHREQAA